MDLDVLFKSKPTTLVSAVRQGDVEKVKDLLRAGVSHPNSADHRGWTPLHEAAALYQAEISKILLEDERTNPDATTHMQETALDIAIDHNAPLAVVRLLEAHISSKDPHDLLYRAASNASPQIVKHFLSQATDLEYSSPVTELTPLLAAIKRGCSETIKLLLDAGANVNRKQCCGELSSSMNIDSMYSVKEPLQFAIEMNCDLNIINLLIRQGANVNTKNVFGLTPLLDAVKRCRIDVALELLNNNADANIVCHDETALTVAVGLNMRGRQESAELVTRLLPVSSLEVLESLCERENFFGLFCCALSVDDEELLAVLLNWNFSEPVLEAPVCIRFHARKLSLTYNFIGPLAFLLKETMEFYRDRTIPLMLQLIGKGISVEPRKKLYFPPLVGALISKANKNGPSPVLIPALKLLLKSGVNVDHMTSFLPDALLFAISTNNLEALSMLLPYSRYTPVDIVRIGISHNKEFLVCFILENMIMNDDYTSLRIMGNNPTVNEVYARFTFNVPSLAVIARQRVRQCLRDTSTTTEYLNLVNSLLLPETLKGYLRFL